MVVGLIRAVYAFYILKLVSWHLFILIIRFLWTWSEHKTSRGEQCSTNYLCMTFQRSYLPGKSKQPYFGLWKLKITAWKLSLDSELMRKSFWRISKRAGFLYATEMSSSLQNGLIACGSSMKCSTSLIAILRSKILDSLIGTALVLPWALSTPFELQSSKSSITVSMRLARSLSLTIFQTRLEKSGGCFIYKAFYNKICRTEVESDVYWQSIYKVILSFW